MRDLKNDLSPELQERFWILAKESWSKGLGFNVPLARKAIENTKPKVLNSFNEKSIEEVISNKDSSALSSIEYFLGEVPAYEVIMYIITGAAKLISVGKGFKVDGEMLTLTCKEILANYRSLTTADLRLCLRKGIRGDYGALYDRFDGQTILAWLREYTEEKMIYSAELQRQIHSSLKEVRP